MSENNIKIPKTQKRWIRQLDEENGRVKYIITSNASREVYYLYEITEDGTVTKIESSKHPIFKRLGGKN